MVVLVVVVVVVVVVVGSFDVAVVKVGVNVDDIAVVESALLGVVDENSAVVTPGNVSTTVKPVCRRVREIPET